MDERAEVKEWGASGDPRDAPSAGNPVEVPKNQAKPVAVISVPVRLSGRRARRDESARDEGPSDGKIEDPVARIVPAGRRRFGCEAEHDPRRPKEEAEPSHRGPQPTSAASASPDSPLLGMNPRAGASAEAGTVGGRVAARDEHDRRGIGPSRRALGYREAVEDRKLDVEQDDLGGVATKDRSDASAPSPASPTTSKPSASSRARAEARKAS